MKRRASEMGQSGGAGMDAGDGWRTRLLLYGYYIGGLKLSSKGAILRLALRI